MITSKRIKPNVKDDDNHSLCLIRKLYTRIKWVSNEKKASEHLGDYASY